jgi:hypothetical protein
MHSPSTITRWRMATTITNVTGYGMMTMRIKGNNQYGIMVIRMNGVESS